MFTDEQLEDVFKYLDEPCYNCKGEGVVYLSSGQHPCDVCYATGYQLTQSGVDLLNFLHRQRKRIERKDI